MTQPELRREPSCKRRPGRVDHVVHPRGARNRDCVPRFSPRSAAASFGLREGGCPVSPWAGLRRSGLSCDEMWSGGRCRYGEPRAAGNASPPSSERLRCVRIRWITAGSSIVARTVIRPPQRGHASTSWPAAMNRRRPHSARAQRARPPRGATARSGPGRRDRGGAPPARTGAVRRRSDRSRAPCRRITENGTATIRCAAGNLVPFAKRITPCRPLAHSERS
jgi:hypothetical protein